MKTTILLCMLLPAACLTFLCPPVAAQQIDLRGRVSVFNSKQQNNGIIKYVDNAYITAPFASTATSDHEGHFQLQFKGIKAGTRVDVTAEKFGYEVVNKADLSKVTLGRTYPLPIYLARKGVLAKAQTELYQISRAALFKESDSIIALLQSDAKASYAALQEVNQRFSETLRSPKEAIYFLKDRVREIEQKLPELAIALAAKNLDFASDLYIEAYNYFKRGLIDSTLAVLDAVELENQYEASRTTKQKAQYVEAQADSLWNIHKLQLDQLIESYALKANGFELRFKYLKAAEQYQQIVAIYKREGLDSLELAEWYNQASLVLKDGGRYSEALTFQKQALDIYNQALDSLHPDLAISFNNLALIHKSLGDYNKALTFQKKALEIMMPLDNSHPSKALIYCNIATIYQDLEYFDKALTFQEQAISIRMTAIDSTYTDLAVYYNNLSSIYQGLKNYNKALKFQKKALELKEITLDKDHPDIAQSYNNLSIIFKSLGNFDKALSLQKRALKIRVEVLDSTHANIAESYNNLASIYQELGNLKLSLEYHKKALKIREHTLGAHHPDLATSYNNLSLVYSDLGDLTQALKLQKKALEIREKSSASFRPSLARSYMNLASIYDKMDEYGKALSLQLKALDIFQQTLEGYHPDLVTLYSNIASSYTGLGEYNKALKIQKKAISVSKKHTNESNSSLTMYHDNLARIYNKTGNYLKALKHEKLALRTNTQLVDSLHPSIAASFNNTALAYYGLRDYDKAIEFIDKAFKIYHSTLPAHHNHIKTTYDNLTYFHSVRSYRYFRKRQYDSALLGYDTLIYLEPTLKVWYRKGLCHHFLGQYHQAIEAYSQAINLDSTFQNALLYRNIGHAYAEIGDSKNAIKFSSIAIQIYLQSHRANYKFLKLAYKDRARQYLKTQQYDSALQDYNTLLFFEPTLYIWNRKGWCHYYLNEYFQAIYAYKQAIALDHLSEKTHLYGSIGMAYAKVGMFKNAKAAFRFYQQLYPRKGWPYRNWALYYALKEEPNEALAQLEKAIDLGYDNLQWIANEPAFDNLRGDARYQAIVARLKDEE